VIEKSRVNCCPKILIFFSTHFHPKTLPKHHKRPFINHPTTPKSLKKLKIKWIQKIQIELDLSFLPCLKGKTTSNEHLYQEKELVDTKIIFLWLDCGQLITWLFLSLSLCEFLSLSLSNTLIDNKQNKLLDQNKNYYKMIIYLLLVLHASFLSFIFFSF